MTLYIGPLPQILHIPLLSEVLTETETYLQTRFQISQPVASTQVIWCNTAESPLGIQALKDLSPRWSVSTGGQPLYVVFLQAETLSPETQNALLKTLEEPPASVQFVLVTARPNVLLPTIRSRCHLVSHQRAINLTSEMTKEVTHILDQLQLGSMSSALVASEQLADREAAQRWIQIALVWSQEHYRQSIESAMSHSKAGNETRILDWVKWQQALLTATEQLEQNAHVKLVMTELFFDYLSAPDK